MAISDHETEKRITGMKRTSKQPKKLAGRGGTLQRLGGGFKPFVIFHDVWVGGVNTE